MVMEELAKELFTEDDTGRIHTELLLFCGIALAIDFANLLIRKVIDKLPHKKSKKL